MSIILAIFIAAFWLIVVIVAAHILIMVVSMVVTGIIALIGWIIDKSKKVDEQ